MVDVVTAGSRVVLFRSQGKGKNECGGDQWMERGTWLWFRMALQVGWIVLVLVNVEAEFAVDRMS